MTKIRQRITAILPKSDEEEFHLKLELKKHSLKFPKIKYQRQDKFTIPSDIIPKSWKELLHHCESYRIQYSAKQLYDHSIFGDFPQAGLNINFVPKTSSGNSEFHPQQNIQTFTRSLSDLIGTSIESESFILTPTALKYFQSTMDETIFVKAIQELISKKFEPNYNFIQIDFHPSKSEDLIIEVYWDSYEKEETFLISDNGSPKEIGVFTKDEKLTNIENIGLNGVRFLFSGSTIEPKKTSFQFTPRQRLIPDLEFRSSLTTLMGLHPEYSLSIQNSSRIDPPLLVSNADDDGVEKTDICKLYSVWNIPKDFFLDKYQLRDDSFEKKGIKLLGLFGDSNLELPSYMLRNWGTEALFELDSSLSTSFEIPLHSRYGSPDSSDYLHKSLQHPLLFWACDLQLAIDMLRSSDSVDGSKSRHSAEISHFESILQVLPQSPFHNKFLDYESYFDDNTIFYQIDRTNDTDLTMTIPVANIGNSKEVQFYTLGVVILAFLFLLRKVLK